MLARQILEEVNRGNADYHGPHGRPDMVYRLQEKFRGYRGPGTCGLTEQAVWRRVIQKA